MCQQDTLLPLPALPGSWQWRLFENGGQNPFRQFNFLMSKTWKYKAVSFESSCGRWWQVNPCLKAGPLSSSPSSAGDQPHDSGRGMAVSHLTGWQCLIHRMEMDQIVAFKLCSMVILQVPRLHHRVVGREGGAPRPLPFHPVPLHGYLLDLVSSS